MITQRKSVGGIGLVVAALIAIAGYVAVKVWQPGESGADKGSFELVELANRDFDGSPALALTFTQPLDPRHNYNGHLEVFEMPRRAGEVAPRRVSEDGEIDDDPSTAQSQNVANTSSAAIDTATEGGTLVKGSWIVGDNPRLLYFPHIKPQVRYVVKLAAGLPAKNDQLLAAGSRQSISTAAVAPAYYFASQGMVLPAKQNGGLPVVTVNVPEVDIQFLKVRPGQLPAFLDQVIGSAPKAQRAAQNTGDIDEEGNDGEYYDYSYRANKLKGAVNNWELDRIHQLTESVYNGRFVTEKKENRRSVTFVPVEEIRELQEPGVYIAVMSQPNRFRYDYQVSYFYVSDLGLHVRMFSKGADAFVSSLKNGKAVRGIEVTWLDAQAKVLARAETDSDGRANFADRPKDARVIVARQGQQISMIALKEPALDLSEFDTAGSPGHPARLYAYSGRNLYRPSENFEVSVLARDADGRPLPAQPIQAILKRPDGKTQFTAMWQAESKFSGYFREKIELPADAPTGFWTLELRVDPADKLATTSFRFGVEEFLPERMKLDLAAKNATLSTESGFGIDVLGTYLYGAPAAGNQLLGVVQYERQKFPLAKLLPGFEFGDVNEDADRSRVELAAQDLDDEGKASIDVSLGPVAKRQSPFTVRTTLSLLESGGRPVVRSIERVYWPAPVLVGLRPLFTGAYAREGSLAEFEVVRADAAGKLRGASALPVRMFRENRNYYWRFDDQRGWNSGYTETDELVETMTVTIPSAGRGKVSLPVKYGRYRVEISDPESGKLMKFRFYAGWSAKSDEAQGIRPDRVALKLDKPAYKEGDTAQLTITPPHGGEALITVESDRSLWVKRMSIDADGAQVSIPVDKAWQRHDLYVSVLVLRPGNEGEKVTPARALGLTHLPLERADRRLAVSLDAPKKMLPDTPLKVKIKVPDAKGQSAVVTLSAVDVGILNITNFKSPDAHGSFFGKLRYGADQYDVYGRLIEKMAGQKGKLKFGGDSAPKPTKDLPTKVRLIDLFSGPVALNAQGEADISLAVPDFNGSLRLMAVVAAAEKFGNADAEVVVAAPLVAELSTPRFLNIGDSATIALDLHNLSGAAQKFKVSIGTPDGLNIRDAVRNVAVKDQQKLVLRFPIDAGKAYGLATVNVKVDGGAIKLERAFALQVQAPTPQQNVMRRFVLAAGESLELKDADLGGFLRNTVGAHVVVSDKPPIDVRSAVQGLLVYPYGCAEQTTSTTYPHVFIDDEAAKRFGLKPFTREQRADMIEKSIARLGAMQAPIGGFSLWGNVSDYEYWLSSYVSNFLLDAHEGGFNVPPQMRQKASDFLLKALQEGVAGLPSNRAPYNSDSVWNDRHYGGSGRFGVLAYGGYVLARESKAPLATLRQMFELRAQAHSGLALVHLGLALKLMGDDQRAQTALAEGVKKSRDTGYWWGDYGSPLRDAALSYALLDRHKVKVDGKENLVVVAADELHRNYYTSTQEKLALFLVGRELATNSDGAPWSVEFSSGAKTLDGSGSLVRQLGVGELANGIKVKNNHKEKLFLELAFHGHPSKIPPQRKDAIALTRELFDGDGKSLGNVANHVFRVGDTVLVKLTAQARSHVGNGLVVDHVPAGLEIENLNIVQGERQGAVQIGGINPAEAMADSRIHHVEFRDDRFVAAVNLRGDITLFYRTRVVTPGKFVFPPVYAEDMYRPDVYGLSGGDSMIAVTDNKDKAAQ